MNTLAEKPHVHCNSAIVEKAALDNSLSHPRSCIQNYDGTMAKTTTFENSLPGTQRFVQSSSEVHVSTCIQDDYQAKIKCFSAPNCSNSSNGAQQGRRRFRVVAHVVIAIVRLGYFHQKRAQHGTPAVRPSTGSRGNAKVMDNLSSQPSVCQNAYRSRIPIRNCGKKVLAKAHHLPIISPSTRPHPPSPPTRKSPLVRKIPAGLTTALSHAQYQCSRPCHTQLHTPTSLPSTPFHSRRLASSHVHGCPPAKTAETGICTAGCGGRKATPVCTHANHLQVMFTQKQLKQL